MKSDRAVPVLLIAALALLVSACHSNPHGPQEYPPILRVQTDPPGATLTVTDLNLQFITPADLPDDVDEDDDIVVQKEGYRTFYGELGDLVQVARDNYLLRLEKL